jgi:hypothetical protein
MNSRLALSTVVIVVTFSPLSVWASTVTNGSETPSVGLIEAKDIIQADATVMIGILIFYSVPYLVSGNTWKEHARAKVVLYGIMATVAVFVFSASAAVGSYLYRYNTVWWSANQGFSNVLLLFAEVFLLIGFVTLLVPTGAITVIAKKETKPKPAQSPAGKKRGKREGSPI